jgi:hypothetical protein
LNKIIVVLISILLMAGCAGSITTTPDQMVDVAFVAVIVAHPESKPVIVRTINDIEIYLEKDITYDELIAHIASKFSGQYAPVAVLLIDYLNKDKPISESWLSLFDGTKASIKTKLDHLKMLASI